LVRKLDIFVSLSTHCTHTHTHTHTHTLTQGLTAKKETLGSSLTGTSLSKPHTPSYLAVYIHLLCTAIPNLSQCKWTLTRKLQWRWNLSERKPGVSGSGCLSDRDKMLKFMNEGKPSFSNGGRLSDRTLATTERWEMPYHNWKPWPVLPQMRLIEYFIETFCLGTLLISRDHVHGTSSSHGVCASLLNSQNESHSSLPLDDHNLPN